MEKQTVFRKVSVKDRLPELSKTTIFIDRLGHANQLSIDRKNEVYNAKTGNWITEADLLISYDYWLEEIELPSDEEIDIKGYNDAWELDNGLEENNSYSNGFMSGANYILNKLK